MARRPGPGEAGRTLMATPEYDAIVVGGRCAGSPTAMLLARKGYRVLVVDKDRFPMKSRSLLSSRPSPRSSAVVRPFNSAPVT